MSSLPPRSLLPPKSPPLPIANSISSDSHPRASRGSITERQRSLFNRSPSLISTPSNAIFIKRNTSELDDHLARASPPNQPVRPESVAASEDVEAPAAVTQPLLHSASSEPEPEGLQQRLAFAYNLSWVINFFLFGAKLYAFEISNSQAVLASWVDSFVDIISQLVIFVAEYKSRQADSRYPVGRTRLETIGVLSCACIMTVSAYAVIQSSAVALYSGLFSGVLPHLETSVVMYAVLGGATVLKVVCYIFCIALSKKSDSMVALAEDHLNDIFSNVVAAATAVVAFNVPRVWWMDPAGGIAISLFIVGRWILIATSQVDKLIGRGAPPEFLDALSDLANAHHDELTVDCIRAYHFGSRFIVEMEVVMPADYTLQRVHDTSLQLQIKLEQLDEVERAFVHVDYAHRIEPEHRTDRMLQGLVWPAPAAQRPA